MINRTHLYNIYITVYITVNILYIYNCITCNQLKMILGVSEIWLNIPPSYGNFGEADKLVNMRMPLSRQTQFSHALSNQSISGAGQSHVHGYSWPTLMNAQRRASSNMLKPVVSVNTCLWKERGELAREELILSYSLVIKHGNGKTMKKHEQDEAHEPECSHVCWR
jgi:hypothetical protein